MKIRIVGTLLVATAVLATPAFAQLDNTPPNVVDDGRVVDRATPSLAPADLGAGFIVEQTYVPPEIQGAIPMAPRVNRATEAQTVDRATIK